MSKRRWTQSEINLLKEGKIPSNRSENSISNMRKRLGLTRKSYSRWLKEHKDQLAALLEKGMQQKEIYKILPYSPRAIQKQVMRMKLQKTHQYKFTRKELEKFIDFLKNNWQQKTPKELTEIWNKDNKKIHKKKVEYHLAKLGIKIPKRESLRMGFLRKKEEEIYKNYKTTKKSEEKIKSLRIELMKKRIEENKDLWTGLPGHNTFSWEDESEMEEIING